MTRPTPKVGDVVEVLVEGHGWTRVTVVSARAIITGYSSADLPMGASWWRWPRWHLSTGGTATEQRQRTHDALVAYAEAHGIERDAPA